MADDLMAQLEAALNDPGLQAAWNDAPAQSGSIFDPPPDGEYDALVHEFEFIAWEAKDGKPAGMGLKVNYQVCNDAKYTGRIVGDMFGLAPERLGFLKGWLEQFGVDTNAMSLGQLRPGIEGSVIDPLLDKAVVVKVRRKGQYVNVYLQQVIEGGWQKSDVTTPDQLSAFTPHPRSAVGAGDDDIPF